MSQEKVDKYKEQKANRKKIIKKEKRMRVLRNCVAAVIGLAVIGWIGYSAVGKYQDAQPREVAEVDFTAVSEYIQSLSATETTTE
ncbi:MAG: hypothetical protein ACRC3H_06760 [Lachnospiraceae bacterium]